MSRTDEVITGRYFHDNPNCYPAELLKELKRKFNIQVEFKKRMQIGREIDNNQYIPADVQYKDGKWIINILNSALFNFDFDRVISHELLHILLRYRNKLPWPDQSLINDTQANIVDIVDHKIINPELDKVFGLRANRKPNPQLLKLEQQLESYLNSINNSTTREEYIKILSNCLSAFKEKMLVFVI